MTSVTGDEHDEQGEQDRLHRLDQLDELLRHFRPIEKLFMTMGAADPALGDGAELLRGCSEIGLALTAKFRKELEQVFPRDNLKE